MDTPSENRKPRFGDRSRLRDLLLTLAAALDEPGADLEAQLSSLLDDLVAAVPSLLTASLSVTVDDYEFAITVPPDTAADPGVTSILIPLTGVTSDESTSACLLLWATTPGAFVDFAADVAHLLDIELGDVVLDRARRDSGPGDPGEPDLSVMPETVALTLTDRATIDYAIGILYERDQHETLVTARAALHGMAERRNTSILLTAQHLVDSTIATTPTPDPPTIESL